MKELFPLVVAQKLHKLVTNNGSNHGSRNTALDAGRSSADHSVAGDVLASLTEEMRMIDHGKLSPASADRHAGISAAAWPAIFAGAFVAVSASVILITLGSGIGFAAISPWPNHGLSATSVTVSAIIWLIVTQWISAALGGYIAGRLRRRWIGTHTHEVFFRDTAHGLITWSVATVISASVLALAVTGAAELGAHAVGAATSTGASAAGAAMSNNAGPDKYTLDKLFRRSDAGTSGATTPLNADASAKDSSAEVTAIMANSALTGSLPDADRTYLSQLVAARTGLSPEDAQKRVDEFVASANETVQKAKAAADKARKAAAQLSLYMALSLLIGAFIASVSAAIGGRLRDEHI
jgi:hypothetical protein